MKKIMSPQERKQLQRMVMEAFKEQMKTLPPQLQQILADDLITAFQNRITVFHRIQTKTSL